MKAWIRSWRLIVVSVLMVVLGCGKESLVAPNTVVSEPFDLSTPDSIQSADDTGRDRVQLATPPNFSGWSVVSGSQTILFGPIWDQDWKVVFYIPNRSSKPPYINVCAKNLSNTWYNYNAYVMLYEQKPYGTYYKMTYVIGGNKTNTFGINMFDATNWALYYHY